MLNNDSILAIRVIAKTVIIKSSSNAFEKLGKAKLERTLSGIFTKNLSFKGYGRFSETKI